MPDIPADDVGRHLALPTSRQVTTPSMSLIDDSPPVPAGIADIAARMRRSA